MQPRESFLYLARFFSGIANWLVFLAIALMVKEAYGAHHVPWIFLVQSLPPLLLSNWLANKVPESQMLRVFVGTQLLAVLALTALDSRFGLGGIYFFVVFNSTVQTVCNPILISLAMRASSKERWQGVHTRLTSIQASTLAIAPIFGGWVSLTFGFEKLLWLTALCGTFGALLMIPAIPKFSGIEAPRNTSGLQSWLPLRVSTAQLRQALLVWSVFLCCGALLNTVEFPLFELQKLDRLNIGWMLGAWGIGNLIAFITSYMKKNPFGALSSSIAFGCSLLLFVFSPNIQLGILSFSLGGFFNSYLAGALRNNISRAIPPELRPLDVWAAVNQRMSLINIAFYGLGGYLLKFLSPIHLSMFFFVLLPVLTFYIRRSEKYEEV